MIALPPSPSAALTSAPHTHPWRLLAVLLCCTLTATVLVLGPATAARAASSTTCTGNTQVSYSPGLTLTRQTITVTETDTINSCTSTDPTITGIVPASVTYSFTAADASCNEVILTPAGNTYTLHWNNGQSSAITTTANATTVTAGIIQQTITGTVTAGEFTGATAVTAWTYTSLTALQCLTPGGVTSQGGAFLIQVIGL